jgi:hypothetical protein
VALTVSSRVIGRAAPNLVSTARNYSEGVGSANIGWLPLLPQLNAVGIACSQAAALGETLPLISSEIETAVSASRRLGADLLSPLGDNFPPNLIGAVDGRVQRSFVNNVALVEGEDFDLAFS